MDLRCDRVRLFFFSSRRRHTRLQGDWSSDVCSSDLRYGDLAELFLTAEERKQIGREVYTVRRQAPAKGLLDDEPAPVHVTGHSMVQPYFGFPQKLSNLLDRPVSRSEEHTSELQSPCNL